MRGLTRFLGLFLPAWVFTHNSVLCLNPRRCKLREKESNLPVDAGEIRRFLEKVNKCVVPQVWHR